MLFGCREDWFSECDVELDYYPYYHINGWPAIIGFDEKTEGDSDLAWMFGLVNSRS